MSSPGKITGVTEDQVIVRLDDGKKVLNCTRHLAAELEEQIPVSGTVTYTTGRLLSFISDTA